MSYAFLNASTTESTSFKSNYLDLRVRVVIFAAVKIFLYPSPSGNVNTV